jgi:cobaltochelatase CobS
MNSLTAPAVEDLAEMLRSIGFGGQPKNMNWRYRRINRIRYTAAFCTPTRGETMQAPDLADHELGTPDDRVSVRELFGIDSKLQVPAFAERSELVPDIDHGYHFNPEATLAILAGFTHNRRVMLQGLHGTGKSTHIEQVAARLNWPCIRVNLDGHISRLDLVGKDAIVIRDDRQVTEFQEGIVPWSLQRPIALIFDEYDAGRPDVMFVIQRLLERDGKFTLIDQNRVLSPHPAFRLFATANTVGLGNSSGLYHGTQLLNHGQIDRWNIVATLNYLSSDEEMEIVKAQVPEFGEADKQKILQSMVALATMTREGFVVGDLSTLMSPRTVISWAENSLIFDDHQLAFKLSFLNKCEEDEHPIIAEYFQRCFDTELDDSYLHVVERG